MKKLSIIVLLLIGIVATAQNSKTQQLTWQGKAAVGGYAPEGTLDILKTSAQFDEGVLSALSIVVDMRTLEQENTQLRDHLRNKDFFHVKKYPVAIFILKSTEVISDNSIILIGDMTIKGITKEERIEAGLTDQGDQLEIKIDHRMNRIDYGIIYNSPSVFEKLKENAVADEFVLSGSIKIPY